MRKIFCYGDSNTFGYNPADCSRFDENTRWTGLLQKNLGVEYIVINDGVCDRTGFVNNPKGLLYSAQRHLPKIITEMEDVNLFILALGTNDFQSEYNIDFNTVEKGLVTLINLAKEKSKQIIIISPVILSERVLKGNFSYQFNRAGIEKSKKAGKIYSRVAKANGCAYFDINKFVKPSDADGLHYDANAHKIIAKTLADFIRQGCK